MGYESRSYQQNASSDFFSRGRVVKILIGLTVVAYIFEGFFVGRTDIDVIRIFGVVPERLVEGVWLWQLITHAFLHEPTSILHVLFNMLFLYWFGTDLAELYGVRRYLVIYFGGAVSCAAAYGGVGYATGETGVPAIGASGAIMSVMVIAAHLFPQRRVLFMFFMPLPLWLLVALYIALDVYYPLVGMASWLSGAGHLGGAAFGGAYYWLGLRTGALDWLRARLARVVRPRAAPPREDEEVDRILDKINAQGMGSLTERERDMLKRASRRPD